ncbi:MAG: iron chelate uptake ABC transporter family permease subunit [Chloracidobacterium sp.]|nr:iron chelate uptake ABC transporter family permease subunit [Chloracidobacterium sp.]
MLDAAKLRSFTFWLLGDLSQATRNGVYLSLGAVIVGTIVLMSQARALNLMMVGERDAFDFGVEVGRVRMLVFGAASLVVGAAVAAGGSVGYVGDSPASGRLSVGSDNRLVVPFSAIAGAIFVVFADTIADGRSLPGNYQSALSRRWWGSMFIYLLRRN